MIHRARNKISRQRGVALLELGMFIPVYIIILALVVDLGRQFARYTQLSSICYEGLRQMTQERELEEGRFNEGEVDEKPIHKGVQEKIRQLVELNRNRIPSSVTIVTQRSDKNVTIEMSTSYQPLIPIFGGNVVVKTVMVGPYLYT